MKNETKAITARLPIDDYEQIRAFCADSGFSMSRMLALVVHVGLILAKDAMKETKEDKKQ